MSKPLKIDEVVVRRAREADAAAMADYMAALTAERLDTITSREAPSVEDERDWVLRAGFAERGMVLMAEVGGEVVGLLDFWGGERADNRHAGYFGMSVAKAWRGRGVGRRMLRTVIDEARGWPGFCRIELECVAWNTPAIGLYESLGFVVEGRMVKAINLRGVPEDMLVMALTW
ncbi:MAG TPA: GNAT family N-acetyltransferase [Caulobacteraceae bacterium]|jgi:RimJ/RimL family protein N-acetyltransferase|nr:GNAT family N-acetyltransferase [Caulobacteraceae bacterium]